MLAPSEVVTKIAQWAGTFLLSWYTIKYTYSTIVGLARMKFTKLVFASHK